MASTSISPWNAVRSLSERIGVSCSMIAMSPLLTSRSTRHTELPASARVTAMLAASRLLPTPPLVEKTVTSWPVGRSASSRAASACAWASDRAADGCRLRRRLALVLHRLGDGGRHRARRGDGSREAGEVLRLDDLAHAAAQGGRQGVGVHGLPQQDHAEVRLVDAGPLGEHRGLLHVHGRADDDRELLRVRSRRGRSSASMDPRGTDPWSIACRTLRRERSVSTIAVIQRPP